jgi:hypothetical protein
VTPTPSAQSAGQSLVGAVCDREGLVARFLIHERDSAACGDSEPAELMGDFLVGQGRPALPPCTGLAAGLSPRRTR